MKTGNMALLATAVAIALSATPALAGGSDWRTGHRDYRSDRADRGWSERTRDPWSRTEVSDVPEIDAGKGLAALAAVCAALAFAWERRRRES
jgi:hypothetical protein